MARQQISNELGAALALLARCAEDQHRTSIPNNLRNEWQQKVPVARIALWQLSLRLQGKIPCSGLQENAPFMNKIQGVWHVSYMTLPDARINHHM